VRVEFQPVEDYDLYMRTSGGTAVAWAAGFNPIGPGNDALVTAAPDQFPLYNHGHSEVGAEQVDGFRAKGCVTYQVDIASGTSPGGAVTVKYWLGK